MAEGDAPGADDATALFGRMLDGELADEEVARHLVRLADRGETADELVAAAGALRQRMVGLRAPPGAIDVCGTGGDGSHSLNVSTAVALVVAGGGVPVAKHGNRAASSRTGAADVLEALGIRLDLPVAELESRLAEDGIAFLFAQRHHPALARLAPVRRRLGRRTIFNMLGPLANPAGVRRQLVGVARSEWLPLHAAALLALGAEGAMVVHGGGLDELAAHAPSQAVSAGAGALTRETVDPGALGLGPHPALALRGGEAAHNAARLRELLEGRGDDAGAAAYRDAVLLNAAAAFRVAGVADDWQQGLARARAALDGGAARERLARLAR